MVAKWVGEFSSISGIAIEAPEGLWKFLASRVVESGIGEEEADVVRVKMDGRWTRVRVTGTAHGGMIAYEYVDSKGFGVAFKEGFHRDDWAKLGEALEQLRIDGVINGGVNV